MTPPRPEKERIAERLRRAREQAGLSQGQVARLLNVHRPTVSEIEAGRRSVSAQELAKFADMYGVEVAWLLGTEKAGDPQSTRARLAARELEKLRPQDLERLLRLIASFRKEPPG